MSKIMTKEEVEKLIDRVSCNVFGTDFDILVERDKKYGKRLYIQVEYTAPCTKTGIHDLWRGRKWYLSSHMTPDEVVKTAYAAFEAAVRHEIMEGFKVDGKILFNPHAHFEALLEASEKEVKRTEAAGDIDWDDVDW